MADKTILDLSVAPTVINSSASYTVMDDGTQTFKIPLARLGRLKKTVRISEEKNWTVPATVDEVTVRIYAKKTFNQIGVAGNVSPLNSAAVAMLGSQGDLYTWGANQYGQLGDNTVVAKGTPQLQATRKKWMMVRGNVSTFQPSFAAIDEFGDLYTWGLNNAGQLGDGTIIPKSTPTIIAAGRKWVSCAVGGSHMLAITDRGELYSWGLNTSGQLGDNTIVTKSTPTLISTGVYKTVYCGEATSFGHKGDGSLDGWGYGVQGELGDGTNVSKSSPVVAAGAKVFQRIVTSNLGAFGIDANGFLWAWGAGGSFWKGDGSNLARSTPVAVLPAVKFKSIAGSFVNAGSAGVTEDGTLYFWGDGAINAAGANTATSTPTLAIGTRKYTAVYGSMSSFLAIGVDGLIYGWGQDTAGGFIMGDGVNRSYSSPTVVASAKVPLLLNPALINAVSLKVTAGDVLPFKNSGASISLGDYALSQRFDDAYIEIEYFEQG